MLMMMITNFPETKKQEWNKVSRIFVEEIWLEFTNGILAGIYQCFDYSFGGISTSEVWQIIQVYFKAIMNLVMLMNE